MTEKSLLHIFKKFYHNLPGQVSNLLLVTGRLTYSTIPSQLLFWTGLYTVVYGCTHALEGALSGQPVDSSKPQHSVIKGVADD